MLTTWQQDNSETHFAANAPTVGRLERVSKTYGTVKALQSVDLTLRAGELLSLLGPNGAGKTTAVKLLLGLAKPNSGRVSVFGADPSMPHNRLRVGAMLQVGRVPETLRVREHIDLFRSYYPNPLSKDEVLAIAGLGGIEHRLFGELSGGQRQRVLFALAICGNPDFLLLDEPTVGLDVEARRGMWDEIRSLVSLGKTILLTTHYLQEADALADRVVVLNQGKIVAEGTPAEIKARTAGKRVRCISSVDPETVRAMTGVVDVKRDREALEIQTIAPEPVLRRLLAMDDNLTGLEVTAAGLEEAFLALTQDNAQASAAAE
jgi:ABC-2 type transport system ATP-binding protein